MFTGQIQHSENSFETTSGTVVVYFPYPHSKDIADFTHQVFFLDCLGWLAGLVQPHLFFLLFETPIVTLSPCAPKQVPWQRVFWGASEF